MQLGDTFLMPCPWSQAKILHLWIVISDPAKHGGIFVIVNLTTDRARSGSDCKLNKGDHPWVTEECFVSFGDALEITPSQEAMINQLIPSKTVILHDPLDEEVLLRIITAAKQSKALTLKYKKYL
jgi:hypothetical protein